LLRLARFRETDAFKSVADMGWPVLSTDLAKWRNLANMNRDSADRTRARPDMELPRLRQFAAEIQTPIDDEYR